VQYDGCTELSPDPQTTFSLAPSCDNGPAEAAVKG
jgi:hypothetical protein